MFQKQFFFILIFALFSLIEEVNACESDCVQEKSWAIGVGVGLGEYSNPLHEGNDRNIAVLPSFYYYGENFYVENMEVGYVLEDNNDWLISVKGKLNYDGLYFNDSIFIGIAASGILGPGNFGDPENVSVGEVERDYSYLAGLNTQYFLNENVNFTFGAFHDVTGVHNGYLLSARSQFSLSQGKWRFQASVGVEFSDSDLNNYYYGLREEDGTSYADFILSSNSNVSTSVGFSYRLNKHLSLIGRYSYQWLGSSMKVSPLVVEDHVTIYFFGISGQIGSD